MNQYNIDIFPWNDSFNTGVDEIDQQHKVLVKILNQVASIITFHRSDVKLDTLIGKLVDYAVFHFESEESYWLDVLPDSEYVIEHRESHNQFIHRVNELKEIANTLSEEQWFEELFSFLSNWLVSHILESDKHMALLVEAVQSGMTEEKASVWAEEQMHCTVKDVINIILSVYKNLSANTACLMREVKAGKQTLKSLIESEGYLKEAMEYAKIGRWSFPYKGEVVDWSGQIFDLFGMELDVVPNPESLCNIIKNEPLQSFLISMQQSFETGREYREEHQIIRSNDGEVRWVECRGKVVYHKDGTPEKISGFVQDITERKAGEDKITKLAYYDSLTSLPNRRIFLDRLNQALALSNRGKAYSAIFFIDIDNFKDINDTHGHEYGDALLQQAAKRTLNCIRQCDTVARIGGDEFVLILSGLNNSEVKAATEAKLIAHKILRVLSLPYQINKHQFNSSASGGITLFNDASISSSELMKQADIAMYQAKNSGKNTAFFYKPQMQQAISERIRLEKRLHKAVNGQQFALYYQPQVNSHNKVIGSEALIRWQHPTDGVITPNNFISLAEKVGLIIPIGDWVLEQACQQLRKWRKDEQTRHLTLSVNVSYKQFHQPDFVSKVEKLLKKYGVDAGLLKIELTETVMVDDMELTISHMEVLKKSGVQFSLDDFGTGYSSLQYLKRLPISQLKIDRSFVFELESSISDQSIVKTTILMANALGLDVIAEGVESAEQRSFLDTHGCRSYQGYFYSKPVPIKEFESYLTALVVT